MLVASTFATATYEKHLWFLLALGPALAGLAERMPLRPTEMAEPPRDQQLVDAGRAGSTLRSTISRRA